MRILARLLCVAILMVAPSGARAQEASGIPLTLDLSTEEMRRSVALSTFLGQAANRGADAGLDGLFGEPKGRGGGAVAERVLRVWLVNLPIAALSNFAAHELGHVARSHETNVELFGFRIQKWPWPVPTTAAVIFGGAAGTAFDQLSVTAGGADGALLQYQNVVDGIYAQDVADYFQWMLAAYAKMEMPAYTWASNLTDPGADGGDPGSYANQFASVRTVSRLLSRGRGGPVIDHDEAIDAAGRTLSRGMWINFADYAFVTGVVRSVEYMATGRRQSRNAGLRLGQSLVVPGAKFTMTPAGFETGLDVRLVRPRYLAHADVRTIDPPAGPRRWAGGIEVQPRLTAGWAPTFRADVFPGIGVNDVVRFTLDGVGGRVEIGARGPLRIGRHTATAAFRIGYKSEGYLIDAPMRRTVLGGVSIGMRF